MLLTTDMIHLQCTFLISWVFIVFQGTVHNKCSKWPPPHARMRTSVHELSRSFEGPGVIANGLRSIRNALVKCLYFQLELSTLRILSAPTDKNTKN